MEWRIGRVTVTKIVELEVTGGSRFILPQATYDEILPIQWLQPHFANERGRLKMSIHSETARRHLHRLGRSDRRAGRRDQPALEGRPDGTPADDDPGGGADCLDGHHGAGAGGGGISV